jgi:hypothetical protein
LIPFLSFAQQEPPFPLYSSPVCNQGQTSTSSAAPAPAFLNLCDIVHSTLIDAIAMNIDDIIVSGGTIFDPIYNQVVNLSSLPQAVGVTSLANRVFVVNGVLKINKNFTFTNCSFEMSSGSKIYVA